MSKLEFLKCWLIDLKLERQANWESDFYPDKQKQMDIEDIQMLESIIKDYEEQQNE